MHFQESESKNLNASSEKVKKKVNKLTAQQLFFSSEGALYVIMPYDYPAQQRTHFLNTHWSLVTNLSINAMMSLMTMISMMTKITKIT